VAAQTQNGFTYFGVPTDTMYLRVTNAGTAWGDEAFWTCGLSIAAEVPPDLSED
jgi:hypothetical protein